MKRPHPLAYYPVFLSIRGKRCVVIGGGVVALRKVRGLLDCGAEVTVVSPTLHPDLAHLAEVGQISPIRREFKPGDLAGSIIAIAATDERVINQKVSDEARDRGVLVNVVDSSEQSDFIIPSFFRRGDLTVAVSTAGMSPALARKIRTKLEGLLGEEFAPVLSIIGDVRSGFRRQGIGVAVDAWQEALDLDLLIGLVKEGRLEEARDVLRARLEAHQGEK